MDTPLTDETPMTREVVLDASIATAAPVQRVETRRIRMRAGLAAGAHVHNGPVVGNVLAGRVLFQVEGQESTILSPGDVFYEPADVVISHFDALDEDVTFLAYFPLTEGQSVELHMV
ncbi:cupin domain-containing protein [Antrihabitans cavernicola]|uniref:Cupin domain-containing protein n=1 Tax=Antrihabitans cavernicola TaxID=2495913 RepID=A0A5A7SKU5_9NOCA|nr:cupin domain-containing protein [Spelaeibacter cavernicola]KAA0024851.1 cupin domain-containing protein [Spelaeibacter cavernicola]